MNPATVLARACLGTFVVALVLAEEVPHSGESDGSLTNAMLHAIGRMFSTTPRAKEPEIALKTITIVTTSGLVTGGLFVDSTVFYGIPYAENPTRFMESELHSVRSTIDASKPTKVMCFQSDLLNNCQSEANQNEKEDCLILNVYVPRQLNRKDKLLPVLFWIHGGAFATGSGTDPWHDGRWLSMATNTVVVTINYRLGAFGFFTYKGKGLSGNQGFGDQQLALKWVQLNIDKFGGDKSQVTIFGESAGGQSVMFHLLSKKSAPYFKRAIMQSNPAVVRYRTEDETQDNTDLIRNLTNCNSLECLQRLSAKNIVDLHCKVAYSHIRHNYSLTSIAEGGVNYIEPFRPVTGGLEFPEQPMAMLRQGRWNIDKDVIVGHTADEMSIFFEFLKPKLQENYKEAAGLFQRLQQGLINKLLEKLVGSNSLQQLFTAYVFSCPSRNLARHLEMTRENQSNVFFYNFKYQPNTNFLAATNLPQSLFGKAFHTSELHFLFGNAPRGYSFTHNDLMMRDMLSSFWGNFSHSGMPGNKGALWPLYSKSSEKNWPYVEIHVPKSSIASDQGYDLCDVMNALGFYSNIDPSNDAEPSIGNTNYWILATIFALFLHID